MDRSDADRMKLLDRLADRVPELDLDQHDVDWTTLSDGQEALLVDGGNGTYFANAGTDLHAVGTLDPIPPGYIGCIVIRPDKTRVLARRCRTRWRRNSRFSSKSSTEAATFPLAGRCGVSGMSTPERPILLNRCRHGPVRT